MGEAGIVFNIAVVGSQWILLSIWLGLGNWPLPFRLLSSILLVAAGMLLVIEDSGPPDFWPAVSGGSLLLAATSLPFGLVKLFGLRLVHQDSLVDQQRRPPSIQFSVRNLLSWTASAGIVAALVRAVPSFDLRAIEPVLILVAATAAIGGTSLWASLSRFAAWPRALAPLAVSLFIGLLFTLSDAPSRIKVGILISTMLLSVAVMVILRLFRRLGWRIAFRPAVENVGCDKRPCAVHPARACPRCRTISIGIAGASARCISNKMDRVLAAGRTLLRLRYNTGMSPPRYTVRDLLVHTAFVALALAAWQIAMLVQRPEIMLLAALPLWGAWLGYMSGGWRGSWHGFWFVLVLCVLVGFSVAAIVLVGEKTIGVAVGCDKRPCACRSRASLPALPHHISHMLVRLRGRRRTRWIDRVPLDAPYACSPPARDLYNGGAPCAANSAFRTPHSELVKTILTADQLAEGVERLAPKPATSTRAGRSRSSAYSPARSSWFPTSSAAATCRCKSALCRPKATADRTLCPASC